MRYKTLLIGGLLILVGIFLIYGGSYGGSGLINFLANSTATTSVKIESQKPMLITVDAHNFTYISTSISINNLRSQQISYTATGDISFYIMDQSEFEAWKDGKLTTIYFSVLVAKSSNSTLIPDNGGTYYFIFDNRASDNIKSVLFNLSLEKVFTEINPVVKYLPPGLIIIGVVLTGLSLWSKVKPKPPAKDRDTLERIAYDLGIDPKGLKDADLRKEIQKEVASKEN